MVELTITVKDEEKRLSKKYLIYDPFICVEDDPTIKDCIEETLKNFDGEPEHILVTIKMSVR